MKTLVILSFATVAALTAQQTEPALAHSTDATVLGLAPGPQLILGAQMVGARPVTGSPYSAQAVTDTTQTLGDGNRIELHSSSMRYRDSQGRERREETLFGAGTSTIFISDPVARMNYTLDQKSHTAQKTGPLPPLPPPAPTHGGSVGIVYLPPSNQAELLKARGLDHGAFVE
jgi:hypothetical protein